MMKKRFNRIWVVVKHHLAATLDHSSLISMELPEFAVRAYSFLELPKTKLKIFRCPVKTCSKSYTSTGHLNHHISMKHNDLKVKKKTSKPSPHASNRSVETTVFSVKLPPTPSTAPSSPLSVGVTTPIAPISASSSEVVDTPPSAPTATSTVFKPVPLRCVPPQGQPTPIYQQQPMPFQSAQMMYPCTCIGVPNFGLVWMCMLCRACFTYQNEVACHIEGVHFCRMNVLPVVPLGYL